MKRFNILLVFLMLVVVCKGQENKPIDEGKSAGIVDYAVFGDKIDAANALSDSEMANNYQKMAAADTLKSKFKATVSEVCQVKGCWMKLQLQNGQETMVRFKNYGFFVPTDIKGNEVIVDGSAYVETICVNDQKHYAKDGGKSEEEIAKITQPQKSYGFEADGVLVVKK
ncbi:MAG: DUF4920 domain-containing protein [Pricia sp.]|nr:DUF4920 domain-containing protein [Pricia sp.]